MENALIISGGDYYEINKDAFSYIIACDKGAYYAKKQNIIPDIIIGDFDSYAGDIYKDFDNSIIKSYPIKKDDTDTMLAVKHALSLNFKKITLTSSLGGRLDHLFSNIQALKYIAEHDAIGEIISEREYIRTVSKENKTVRINKKEGYSLSLFALSDICTGVSITGSEYDCSNITLTNNFPLGQSNKFLNDKVTVSVSEGILLIILSKL